MIRTLSVAFAAALSVTAVPSSRAQDLPPGPGHDYVVASCGSCHPLNRLRAGYTADGWRIVLRMMHNAGVTVPECQAEEVVSYLATNFPERPRPAAVIVPGPVDIAMIASANSG